MCGGRNLRLLLSSYKQMTEVLGFKRKSMFADPLEKPIQTPLEAKQQTSSSLNSILSRPGSSQSSSNHGFDGEAWGHRPVDSVKQNFAGSWSVDVKHFCEDDKSGLKCQPRDEENSTSIATDRRSMEYVKEASTKSHNVGDKPDKVDMVRIKVLIRTRKKCREVSNHMLPVDDSSKDAWIQRSSESGIVRGSESATKKRL